MTSSDTHHATHQAGPAGQARQGLPDRVVRPTPGSIGRPGPGGDVGPHPPARARLPEPARENTPQHSLDHLMNEMRDDLNRHLAMDFPEARLHHAPHRRPLAALHEAEARLDAHLADLAVLVEALTGGLPDLREQHGSNCGLALAPALLSCAERMGQKLTAAASLLQHTREHL